MADRVELELAVLADKAIKSVDNFTKTTQKRLDSINFNSAVSAINAGFELLDKTAGAAFRAIEGFASKAISEAADAEQSQQKLVNALKLSGQFSKEAVDQFNELASALQRTTVFSDDQVLSAVALAKQYNLTNTETQKVIQSAVDLAAATGTDLDSAVQTVAQSFNGFVDKGLAKAIPELKKLTTEALLNGAAIDVLNKRFGGSAEALGSTFNGAIQKAKNSFSDLLEEIGSLVTQNNFFIGSIKLVNDAFVKLKEGVANNKDALQELIKAGFIAFVSSVPLVIRGIDAIDSGFATLRDTVRSIFLLTTRLPTAILQAVTGSKDALEDLKNALISGTASEQQKKRQREVFEPLEKAAEDLAKKIIELETKTGEKQTVIAKTVSDNKIKFERFTTSKLKEEQEKRTKDFEEAEKRFDEIRKKQLERATKEPLSVIVEDVIKVQTQGGNFLDGFKNAINRDGPALAAGFLSSLSKGAAGAADAIAGAIGIAFGPALAGPIKEIVSFLAQGPDKVRETVTAFVTAIPQIIENIILSLPALAQALIDSLSELPAKLIERLPDIITKLIQELPRLIASFAALMPRVAILFATSLISNIPKIVESFAKEFLKIPEQFAKALLNAIPGGSSVAKGAGGFLKKVTPFAEGGRVPDLPRFENDRFPARLNAGEQVLSKDLSSQLEQFLASGGQQQSNQPIIVQLQVGQQELARTMLNLNRGGFRVS